MFCTVLSTCDQRSLNIKMSEYNFCLINKNKIYEEIHEMIEDEELSMSRQDDTDKIIYQINLLVNFLIILNK